MPAPVELKRPDEQRRIRLESWKDIAQYLQRSVRTVQRWEHEEALPVHRLDHTQRSSVYAFSDELEAWRKSRSNSLPELAESSAPESVPHSTVRRPVVLAACGATFLLAMWVLWPHAVTNPSSVSSHPLTALPGNEYGPVFSPDGKSVVFTHQTQQSAYLYMIPVTGGDPIRVTRASDGRVEFDAAWSPDGVWLAFVRQKSADFGEVVLIPYRGGPERSLGQIDGVKFVGNSRVPRCALAWTPDSRYLIASHSDGAEHPNRLWRIDISTGTRTALTNPPPDILGDGGAAISPDRSKIAFHRVMSVGVIEIFTAPVRPDWSLQAEPIAVTKGQGYMASPVWLSSRELLYFGYRDGAMRLFRQQLGVDSEPVLGSLPAEEPHFPSYSSAAKRLVYEVWRSDPDFYRVPVTGAGETGVDKERYVSSTRLEMFPEFSPDGTHIAFTSTRAGAPEVWTCRADQTDCHQRTSLRASVTGVVHWSPNGQALVMISNVSGKGEIYTLNADGSGLQNLSQHPSDDTLPYWSHDGLWIYFSSNRSGRYQVLRMPAQGGVPVVVADQGYSPVETGDGRWLYYLRNSEPSSRLIRRDLRTGQEFDDIGLVRLYRLASGKRGVYFVRDGDPRKIWYSAEGMREPSLTYTASSAIGYGICLSPDESSLVFSGPGTSAGSDLVIIDNFR